MRNQGLTGSRGQAAGRRKDDKTMHLYMAKNRNVRNWVVASENNLRQDRRKLAPRDGFTACFLKQPPNSGLIGTQAHKKIDFAYLRLS